MIVQLEVPRDMLHRLSAAIEMMSGNIGESLSGPLGDETGMAKRTQLYTDAAIALGLLRKAMHDASVRTPKRPPS